jgi:hypothetical protein
MPRVAQEKIGTDRRFQAGLLLLGVAVAIVLGLITANVAVVGIALGVTAIVTGLNREMTLRRDTDDRR